MILLNQQQTVHVGIDIGSTTIKLLALDQQHKTLFQSYERHNGAHRDTLLPQLQQLEKAIGGAPVLIAITGSQGGGIAR